MTQSTPQILQISIRRFPPFFFPIIDILLKISMMIWGDILLCWSAMTRHISFSVFVLCVTSPIINDDWNPRMWINAKNQRKKQIKEWYIRKTFNIFVFITIFIHEELELANQFNKSFQKSCLSIVSHNLSNCPIDQVLGPLSSRFRKKRPCR